jgi:AcrR family transcriptional regulator
MNDRLTKADWLGHGLRTLASEGPNALKVGPMATKLNVTRGSFYWHFRDIGDFRSQILQSWADSTTDDVRRDLEAESAGPDRLRSLMQRVFGARRTLDRAIRSWAANDETVAEIVASVDAKRVAYITELLLAAGVDAHKASRRAAFLYWALLGQAFVMDPQQSRLAASGMADIGELFES